MGRPNKKVITDVTEDDPPIIEDQSLKKDASQYQNSSRANKAKEQRLIELEEQVLRKKKNLRNVAQDQEKSLSNKE